MVSLVKKNLVFTLALAGLAGCSKQDGPVSKQEYTCSYGYYYVKEEIAFGGFQASELDLVVLQKFKVGSNYSDLIDTDTLNASNAIFQGDTAYATINNDDHRGFFSLGDSAEYKVKIPVPNREYAINLKRGKTSVTWTQDVPCSAGAGQTRYTSFITTLDGLRYYPYSFFDTYPAGRYFICLRR